MLCEMYAKNLGIGSNQHLEESHGSLIKSSRGLGHISLCAPINDSGIIFKISAETPVGRKTYWLEPTHLMATPIEITLEYICQKTPSPCLQAATRI